MKRLEGKVSIITGAASGMGKEEAIRFSKEGAKVVIADLNLEGAQAVAKEIKQLDGQAIAVQVDISKKEDLEYLVQTATDHFQQIDILVNNAGIFDKYTSSLETTEELWDLVFSVNVKSLFRLTNLILPGMIERKRGSIVNVASTAGLLASSGGAAYTASKHAVIGYTKHLAATYAKYGIKVNAICPSVIATPMTVDVLKTKPLDHYPIGRFGEVEEVADLAVFLASDESRFINGAQIPIDGGYSIV